jgi:hypothetical protein
MDCIHILFSRRDRADILAWEARRYVERTCYIVATSLQQHQSLPLYLLDSSTTTASRKTTQVPHDEADWTSTGCPAVVTAMAAPAAELPLLPSTRLTASHFHRRRV